MTNPRFWKFIKWLLIITLAVILISGRLANRISSTDFETMAKAVTEATDLTPMQLADNQMLKRLYGLDGASFDGVLLYYPTTNMGAEELLLIKMADTSQAAEVQAALEKRLATQKKSFDGYGAEQTAMLEKSIIKVRGNYALFISAADPARTRQAFDRKY